MNLKLILLAFCTLSVNFRLYKSLVEELVRELEKEFAKNTVSRASGMVIDTMGWIVGAGYEVIISSLFFWFFLNQLVCFLI